MSATEIPRPADREASPMWPALARAIGDDIAERLDADPLVADIDTVSAAYGYVLGRILGMLDSHDLRAAVDRFLTTIAARSLNAS